MVVNQKAGSVVEGGAFVYGQFHDGGGTISSVTLMHSYLSASSGSLIEDVTQTHGAVIITDGATLSAATENDVQITIGASGSAIDTILRSGASLTVSNGGVTSGATISSGSNEYTGLYGAQASAVQGTDFDTTIMSGGAETLYNRGVSISAYISSGGFLSAGKGNAGPSSTTNLTVVSAATVYAGGKIQAQNDTLLTDTVLSGGTLDLAQEGAYARGTVILSGGVEILTDRWVDAIGDYIESGGTLNIAKTNTTVKDGHLYYSGSVDFSYLGGTIESASMSADDVLSVKTNNGDTASIQFASSEYTGNDVFKIDGDTVTLVCFLEGTQIRTPDGERAVETLTSGDTVLTWDWRARKTVEKTLSWVGRQPVRVKPGLLDDEAGYPVRIRANAMAPGVPLKDLLVTPEHCLFVENGFIPARMLVNGSSIIYDRTMTQFSVFHIETTEHAVLWSDGALSESYLDTGNRRNFAQIGGEAVVLGRAKSWPHDAAAPLMTSREIVEPVFTSLVARAAELGFGEVTPSREMVEEPDLHLLTREGQVIRAYRHNKRHVLFHVPAGVSEVRLASRASRPSDTIGPFVDDRRMLGILTGKITLFGTQTTVLSDYLNKADLRGWQGVENGTCRWTDGDAYLPLERRDGELSTGVLAVEVLAAGPYIIDHTRDIAVAISA
ncbi:Hint domain-containing protein [Neokomagataea thailandica]|uniref:Hint domain-containing protein n=1 Tax=Neokomagataea TaxID=1223423 RepID=UPI00147268B9|nr:MULTISPECIES: Hint domain-containing protein [Neokomagataea]